MKKSLFAAAFMAAALLAQTPKSASPKSTAAGPRQKQVKEETTPQIDPVCGMTIDPKTAEGKYAYKGKMYYFCSKDDQQTFVNSPDTYAGKK